MQIILIRHGQAEHQSSTDAKRALTALGESQAQQTAAWLVNHDFQLDGLFVSPYLRAQQTAVHISQALDILLASFFVEGDLQHGQAFQLAQAKVIELPLLTAGLGKQLTNFVPHP